MRKLSLVFLLFLFSKALLHKQVIAFLLERMNFSSMVNLSSIISGELHPAQTPKEYWRHRIQMVRAMGCNTVAAYVFWNYHESSPGVFDFRSENRDIAEFIRICQREGMWVLLRPGPYVCAEWDFGGLPPYLLKIPDIKIRCMDERYMQAVTRYIVRLAKEIQNLQVNKGGPIIMLQVENEYGSYGNDKSYITRLGELWKRNGFTIPFYTADGPAPALLEAGTIVDAVIGLDSGSSEADFDKAKKQNPNVPAFSSETYSGWLTHWLEKWQRPDTINLKKEIEFLLSTRRSFNLYLAHGGTNFGFTAGANAFSPIQYQPDVTSYDYDAPINEHGAPTRKFYMLRNLISRYVSYSIPPTPSTIKMISTPSVHMRRMNSIWEIPSPSFYSPQPVPMEYKGQNNGMVLYQTILLGHKGGKLTIWEPHDYALVFLNREFIDTVFRDGGKWTIDLPPDNNNVLPILQILVEGMGRINYGQFMIDRKGITDRVTLNGMTLMTWFIQNLPFDYEMMKTGAGKESQLTDKRSGYFFKGLLNLDETGDTYLDLSSFSKGIVYVNGHNLGRYWNVGPQQRLYCPASWLKKGENEIILFDLHQLTEASITGHKNAED